jgi:hypothetical protein
LKPKTLGVFHPCSFPLILSKRKQWSTLRERRAVDVRTRSPLKPASTKACSSSRADENVRSEIVVIASCQYNPAVVLLLAHSIPYQNDIQYFSLRHRELRQLLGLTIKLKKAIWIMRA